MNTHVNSHVVMLWHLLTTLLLCASPIRKNTVQDLTVVLTSSSLFGCLFEAIKQPVLNGYIISGSLIGPDGLALVKEVVQVESLAQV
jgi:Kef-type K+ transport system membrane component KefB